VNPPVNAIAPKKICSNISRKKKGRGRLFGAERKGRKEKKKEEGERRGRKYNFFSIPLAALGREENFKGLVSVRKTKKKKKRR